MSSFHDEYYPGVLPNEPYQIDYLSVEYLCERRWEASPVVFNIKCLIERDRDDFDFDAWGEPYNPTYKVYRLFMEPKKGDPAGCLCVKRLPDMIGRSPELIYEDINRKRRRDEEEELKEEDKDWIPVFDLAPDSLAEFYLDINTKLKGRLRYLSIGKRDDTFDRSLFTLGSDLGSFNFFQPDTSKPHKYYDSRDFICQFFARLLKEGFIKSTKVIWDAPFGIRTKVETEHQQCPYTTTSNIDFSAVIGNLFFSNTQGHREWKNPGEFQGVYQPIIRGQFTNQWTKAVQREEVPETIHLPYINNKSQIDRERSRCARRIYQTLQLKTLFYEDSLPAEPTKSQKDSKKGPQMSTQPCQHCGTATKSQPAITTSTRTVPAALGARPPGTKASIKFSPSSSSLKAANTAASHPHANPRSAVEESSSRPLPSAIGRTRKVENVPTASSSVAAARSMHAMARIDTSARGLSSRSGHAKDATLNPRITSSQAADPKMPARPGGSAVKEGGYQQTASVSKKRTLVGLRPTEAYQAGDKTSS